MINLGNKIERTHIHTHSLLEKEKIEWKKKKYGRKEKFSSVKCIKSLFYKNKIFKESPETGGWMENREGRKLENQREKNLKANMS